MTAAGPELVLVRKIIINMILVVVCMYFSRQIEAPLSLTEGVKPHLAVLLALLRALSLQYVGRKRVAGCRMARRWRRHVEPVQFVCLACGLQPVGPPLEEAAREVHRCGPHEHERVTCHAYGHAPDKPFS